MCTTTSVFVLRLIGMLINYVTVTVFSFSLLSFPNIVIISRVIHSHCDQFPSQPSATLYRPPMVTVTAHSDSSYQYYTSVSAFASLLVTWPLALVIKNICMHSFMHVTCLPQLAFRTAFVNNETHESGFTS